LFPLPVKSVHVVPDPGYEEALLASKFNTNPEDTIAGPELVLGVGVTLGVLVGVILGVIETVTLGVIEADGVIDAVILGVIDGVILGVIETEGVTETVTDGVTETEGVTDTVTLGVIDTEGVADTVILGVTETVTDGVIDTLGVADTVTEGVTDAVIEGVIDTLGVVLGGGGTYALTCIMSNPPPPAPVFISAKFPPPFLFSISIGMQYYVNPLIIILLVDLLYLVFCHVSLYSVVSQRAQFKLHFATKPFSSFHWCVIAYTVFDHSCAIENVLSKKPSRGVLTCDHHVLHVSLPTVHS
jgi:hypothetical protein